MKIFTITMAPINPPYNDGAKNIMIGVARRIREHSFYFVSSLLGKKFQDTDNIIFVPSIFQKQGKHSMSFIQKLYIFLVTVFMIRRLDVFQFFFTPQPYFSAFYKKFVARNQKKSIQIVTSIHTLLDKNREEVIPSLFFAGRVVVHSDYAMKKLSSLGVKNVVRIYPGVDTSRFKALPSRMEGNPKSAARIVYSGTYKILNDSYSFDDFLKIATYVTERLKDVEFVMACRIRTREDAALKKEFELLLNKRGIKNFILLDTIDDMPSLFNSCTAGIMPAKRPMAGILEIPLVLLELAALRKPVFYGDVTPLDELHSKGIGVKIGEGTIKAYAENLIRCIKDKNLAYDIGKRSEEAVAKDFTMETVTAQYRKIYSDIQRQKSI